MTTGDYSVPKEIIEGTVSLLIQDAPLSLSAKEDNRTYNILADDKGEGNYHHRTTSSEGSKSIKSTGMIMSASATMGNSTKVSPNEHFDRRVVGEWHGCPSQPNHLAMKCNPKHVQCACCTMWADPLEQNKAGPGEEDPTPRSCKIVDPPLFPVIEGTAHGLTLIESVVPRPDEDAFLLVDRCCEYPAGHAAKEQDAIEDCMICMEPNEDPGTVACNCGCKDICKQCISSHISIMIGQGHYEEIKCPVCEDTLSDEDIRQNIPSTEYETFEARRLMYMRSRDPQRRWCPRPGCETSMVIYETLPNGKEKQLKTVQCTTCAHRFCTLCHEPYHGKRSCEAAAKKRARTGTQRTQSANKVEFLRYAKNQARRCPGCNIITEKIQDGACNHLICPACRTEWCYLCGKKIPPTGHFDTNIGNLRGCPGLQFKTSDISFHVRCKARAKLVGKYTVRATGVVIALPVICVAIVPVGLFFGLSYASKKFRKRRAHRQELQPQWDADTTNTQLPEP